MAVRLYRPKRVSISKAQLVIRNRFRLLWEQHVYWTRMTILAIAFDSPDLDATLQRLLRNVPDFEAALDPFYKTADVNAFGQLLMDHLVIAAELVQAVKAGDSAAAADAEKRWYANAEEIVRLMHKMNPFWSPEVMRPMWLSHLAMTKDEAVFILKGQFTKSVVAFNAIEKQALMVADSFSKGIIQQFSIS